MGSDNPKLSENQDSCSQTKPVRNKKGLLLVQLLSLRQKCRWSQLISGLIAVSTSKSHLHQWPFCYQCRQRCQELQDQRAFVLLQALAWPPSLQCLCRAIIPYDRWGMEAKRCLSSTRQPVQERGLNSPQIQPSFQPSLLGERYVHCSLSARSWRKQGWSFSQSSKAPRKDSCLLPF